MWLAYGVLRATTDGLSGICSLGSALGQSAQADCNPACFPMGDARTIAYCSDYHDGFAQGTQADGLLGNCVSTEAQKCDCHAQDSNGACSCGSSTMGRHNCWKSTKACLSCPAGKTAPCGCSTTTHDESPTRGCQGATSITNCNPCAGGTFKAGDSPGGCQRYYGGYDTIPQNNDPDLRPGKNYSIPFTEFIPKLTCFLGGCRNILFIIKY